ncbi:peptidase, partial [Streptomyces ipomoeae]
MKSTTRTLLAAALVLGVAAGPGALPAVASSTTPTIPAAQPSPPPSKATPS